MARRGAQASSSLRQAVNRAKCDLSALEGLVARYVTHGTDSLGTELTRTEFRAKFAEQADCLRANFRDITNCAILGDDSQSRARHSGPPRL